MQQNAIDPMFYLRKLIPRNNNTFEIPILTVNDTRKLLKQAKNSWTLCNDNISMAVLKKIKLNIAPHLTHL